MTTRHELMRKATAEAHRRLETRMGLSSEPISRERVSSIVAGFYDFHAAWEPWLARQGLDPSLLHGRSRLGALRSDMVALNVAVPSEPSPLELEGAGRSFAMGSLYVIEGSTLGGKLITRWLASNEWLPAGGLKSFDPYGAETGSRWRAYIEALEGFPSNASNELVAGAEATFSELEKRFAGMELA